MYEIRHLLTGADAERGAVLRLLPSYSIFHFAGHAVFNPEQPGSSYLALASDGAAVGDGSVAAREIAELRLPGVQLAVLSACSSLSPRPTRTGAAVGLAYSFLRAGVPATISTLWDVEDDASTDLMVEFHRRLTRGEPASGALRQAQLQALRLSRSGHQAPAGWAAFIYTGP
jgi:CHAT domain-containing protein